MSPQPAHSRARLRPTLAVLAALMVPAGGLLAQEANPIQAILTHAPQVPPPIARSRTAHVIVSLEARELVGQLADGVEYTFWTFGGRVPGSFIRVRQGDLVEIRLANRWDSRNPHNIDLHAVTGPGGGAAASFVAPGDSAMFTFEARHPGLYVYHCATAPVGMHVSNGMYGLILVEPPGGLPPADREFYVMLGELYTDGEFGAAGLRRFNMDKALRETPDYVVFNGAVGSLTGERALTANVGERVRLFFGNAGPNLSSSLHVIGEIFDRVLPDGSGRPNENAQTAVVPPGSAAIIDLSVEVPGTYALADHAFFRAFNKGALGTLLVAGAPTPRIFAGPDVGEVYLLEGGVVQTMPAPADLGIAALSPEERIERGGAVYARTCQACHQRDGTGIPGSFPPLAESDFLNADIRRAVGIVLEGTQGPIVVNGTVYNAVMPALRLTDDDIANVLSYVYSQWNNSGAVLTTDLVRQVRVCPWCNQ